MITPTTSTTVPGMTETTKTTLVNKLRVIWNMLVKLENDISSHDSYYPFKFIAVDVYFLFVLLTGMANQFNEKFMLLIYLLPAVVVFPMTTFRILFQLPIIIARKCIDAMRLRYRIAMTEEQKKILKG